jgi:hypothetical protein
VTIQSRTAKTKAHEAELHATKKEILGMTTRTGHKRPMFQAVLSAALVVVAALACTASATAKVSVEPGVYDPGHLGTIHANWKKHAGMADHFGKEKGLILKKAGVLTDNAAAYAGITGVNGTTLNALGFNVKGDSACAAGAPRFNVKLTNGDFFFVGCSSGDATPSVPGWSHVSFSNADFTPAGAYTWPGYGNAEVKSLSLIQDEVGTATLDNIRVNNHTIHGS